jgi:hypothetical protein
MNYDYEKAYKESIDELYRTSLELQKTGYVNIVGKNDEVFIEHEKAVKHFNAAQKIFFGDTLDSEN